jgi:hypothetical protein
MLRQLFVELSNIERPGQVRHLKLNVVQGLARASGQSGHHACGRIWVVVIQLGTDYLALLIGYYFELF